MSERPRIPDRAVLGESWAMASTASMETDSRDAQGPASATPQAEKSKDNGHKEGNTGQSTSSSWTMSGPELVMPSIHTEASLSETSWVKTVRSKDNTSPGTMRKRRKISAGQQQQDTAHATPDAGSSPAHNAPCKPKPSLSFNLTALCRERGTLVRAAINSVMLILILHLLVLPELVYQAQNLCTLRPIKTLYPNSCIRLTPRSSFSLDSIATPEQTLTAAQNELELIFASALDTLSPLSHTLKESELMLEDLHSQLASTLPDARNALDLELQGGSAALRAATWEFDSLRADLRSAVDSLLASPPSQDSSAPSISRDTRLAVQLRRRAEYLDRLRAQLRSKADSLGSRFATLDDHLEAVEGIVSREERRASLSAGVAFDEATRARLQSVLHSLSSYAFGSYSLGVGSRFSAESEPGEDPASGASRPVPTLALLRLAATHHRAVAESVSRLSRQLAHVPRSRLGQRGDDL